MYFEIYKSGKLVKRGKNDILNELSWDVELMEVPQMDLTLPIDYLDYLSGREEVKVYANDKVFYGIVIDIDVNKEDETIDVQLNHIVHEWTYRQISINNAIKDKNVNIIYKGSSSNKAGGVTVTANPFNLYVKEVNSLTDKQIISRAGANAYKGNGDTVSMTVDRSKLQAKAGDYDVTFKAGSAKVTVKATVKANPKKGDKSEDMSTDITDDASVIDNLSDIYADTNFAYPGWTINFLDGAGDTEIDYVYSRQNKLEGLTTTCELTDDLFWRVDFSGDKVIDIGAFGEKQPYIISKKPKGETNIPLITEPTIDHDFENVINLATVYSQKSDSGVSSLTLREVYMDKELVARGTIDKRIQKSGFPVVILRNNVNNERDYSMYTTQYPKLGSNNELEYAVLDTESIALEGGTVIEDSYEFNDLGSFNTDSKKITDKDRIKAAKTAYLATIKKLKQARRSYQIKITTGAIPVSIKVGNKIRFIYDNSIYKLDACSNYMKKILTMNDWFYITHIDYEINEGEAEIASLTLEKYLKIERETKNS